MKIEDFPDHVGLPEGSFSHVALQKNGENCGVRDPPLMPRKMLGFSS